MDSKAYEAAKATALEALADAGFTITNGYLMVGEQAYSLRPLKKMSSLQQASADTKEARAAFALTIIGKPDAKELWAQAGYPPAGWAGVLVGLKNRGLIESVDGVWKVV